MNEELKTRIEEQIALLTEEVFRVKEFANSNNFDCTTAPFVIICDYRKKLKEHIKILKMNLE